MQSSHRKKCRTTDNVFIIRSLFEKYCTVNNQKIYACFIDFRKAFDSIWHEGLMLKLLRAGIGGLFYNVIKNMYSKAKASVKNNGTELSDPFSIKRGVKQGDVLSPLLFNLYINDIIPLLQQDDGFPPSLGGKTVGCLLYADDLVILSTSPDGLQSSLNKVIGYWHNWKLDINYTKSKTLCFNKSGRGLKQTFNIGDTNLSNVQRYTYLGIELSASGSFKPAQEAVAKKAMRALFKLKNLLYDSSISVLTSLKLFDQLIKPVCLYGSEIWGFEFMKKHDVPYLFSGLERAPCEKVHISFCRFILGVHRKSQLSAIRGELGRVPLATDAITNVLQYDKYLHTKEPGSLLHCALNSSAHNQGIKSWYGNVSKMKEHLGSISNRSRKLIQRDLRSKYGQYWWDKIQLESKMRTYIQFKSHFEFEDYLNISNVKHRKAMTKLRISAHRLAIERGRYNNIPLDKRICTTCQGQIIEDEYHFLLKCIQHVNARQAMLHTIDTMCENFKHLSEYDKFTYLLSAAAEIAVPTAKFISDCLP